MTILEMILIANSIFMSLMMYLPQHFRFSSKSDLNPEIIRIPRICFNVIHTHVYCIIVHHISHILNVSLNNIADLIEPLESPQ